MSLLKFKPKVSKNELVRQRRTDTMVNALFEIAVKMNTCKCGHWAIRHLRIFGTPCKEPGCQCWKFRPVQEVSETVTATEAALVANESVAAAAPAGEPAP